jgi:HNH endonuclease/VRR-NUC domain
VGKSRTRNGYGVISRGADREGNALVHRAALEVHFGEPIPDNREVDHLCRNKLCCNPAHLEIVSRQQHARRSVQTVINLRERDWHQQVVEVATLYGWRHFHAFDMRRSDAGWPDIVLCRPPELLIVELKAEHGKLQVAQEEWLADLWACGIETAVWRPSSFDEIHGRLRRR